jgi:RNA polymerase sigma-70 factor (ECF subfamily)
MRSYHLYFAARADLLRRAGRGSEAGEDDERALGLATNQAEQRYLKKRIAELAS